MAELGQWGDTFGALNALFSAVAVIGVLATLRMQAREISDQQTQIEKQSERLERSEFEATFFRLFELSRELRDGASWASPDNHVIRGTGRRAFELADNHMRDILVGTLPYGNPNGDIEGKIRSIYHSEIYIHAIHSLGPYFRVLYTILRRISEKGVLDTQTKAQYGNLVRSHLSNAEVALLAANALTEASNDFRKYVIEFRLLKYLPDDDYKGALRMVYPPEAFLARD